MASLMITLAAESQIRNQISDFRVALFHLSNDVFGEPVYDVRAEIAEAQKWLTSLIAKRNNADAAALNRWSTPRSMSKASARGDIKHTATT